MEHNKPNWDKLQAISVLTSDSPKPGPPLKKNPYIYIYLSFYIYDLTTIYSNSCTFGRVVVVVGAVCTLLV